VKAFNSGHADVVGARRWSNKTSRSAFRTPLLNETREFTIVTPIQTISLLSFAVFSILDLRTRFVPFIEAFFVIALFFAFPEAKLHVTILVLAVVWGLFRRIPARFALPFLFYPLSWPALLVGSGVRNQMIGRADLFAVAMIGFLFPFPAVIMSLLGFEFRRQWWIRRGNYGLIPAVPGLFLGLAAYSLFQLSVG
jgi:hypothetical protein